uniref:Lipase_3 domain-containing protein n=1 Tax=Strongyloides venezuelensis TaxID=75913 RepID=A0A0K0F3P9_STRVS
MFLLIKLLLFSLKINILISASSIFYHRQHYSDTIAKNLYLLAHESYFQDAGRCIPKNLEGFETFVFYTNRVLVCDKFKNKCGFYVLASRIEKVIIIAFSGSISSTQTLIQTFSSFRERIFYKNLGLVNRYYVNSFERLWHHVKRVFYEPLFKNFKVYITGHSLGGVHAALAALNIHLSKLRKSQDIFLYTFGEPRFGSYEFAVNFDKRIPYGWRVVRGSDVVPHFPPCKKMREKGLNFFKKNFGRKRSKLCDPYDHNGYYHHSREIWYPKGTTNYFFKCDGFPKNEDFQCSDGLVFNKREILYNLKEHRLYFFHMVKHNYEMYVYRADGKCNIEINPKNRRGLLNK